MGFFALILSDDWASTEHKIEVCTLTTFTHTLGALSLIDCHQSTGH